MLKLIENPVPWPNGAKVAVCLSFDIDSDSLLQIGHASKAEHMVAAQSWLRYDRIAVRRLVDMFNYYKIRQTFFFPAWCMEKYPELVDCIQHSGHEIAYHGYLHEHPNEQSYEDEKYWLQKSIAVFEKMTGTRPRGARAPLYNYSGHSTELLIKEGFLYDASLMGDDVPYLLKCDAGELLELPSHWAMDDWPQYVHAMELDYVMPIRSPAEAMQVFMAEFEAMWRHQGMLIGVWHPFASGRLARCEAVANMIEKMIDRGQVWFASMEEIAQHIQACRKAGTYQPRIEDIPQYDAAFVPTHK